MVPQPGATTRLAPNRKLKVAYCVPHANVTGGLKMLLEQVGAQRAAGAPCRSAQPPDTFAQDTVWTGVAP